MAIKQIDGAAIAASHKLGFIYGQVRLLRLTPKEIAVQILGPREGRQATMTVLLKDLKEAVAWLEDGESEAGHG